MKVLMPFAIAFAGLLMITLLPNKTIFTTLLSLGLMIGGVGMTIYNLKRGGF
ncbi:MAG TPA: hypothetical protein VLF43_01925 [Candidatus Saccharimonadales bacterium]|nr:hypothetical protein [Candidatus Saccharimonadales bacterium]